MGALLGLIFGGGLALVLSSFGKSCPEISPKPEIEKYWPTFCDDLSAGIRAGLSIPEATWQASIALPVFVQLQFEKSKNSYVEGMPFSGCLNALESQLKNHTFTRIVHLILTAQTQNAAAIAGLLNEQAHNLRSDLALINEILGKQAVTRVSAKVAAMAPVVVLILTSTRVTVREAYLSALGLVVILLVTVITAISYLVMRDISQIKVLKNA